MAGRLIPALLVVLAMPALAGDGALPDPTRPAGWLAGDVAAAGQPAAPSGLQTVIVGKDRKSAAVIDGQYVAVGGKIGERRLLRVTENSATLKGPEGMETLMLVGPGIEKKASRPVLAPNANNKAAKR